MAFTGRTAKVKLLPSVLAVCALKGWYLTGVVFLCVIYLEKRTQNLKNQRGNFCCLSLRKRQIESIERLSLTFTGKRQK